MFFGKKNIFKKIRKDIKQDGWSLLLIKGDPHFGFCYTVGLWETYGHPEIMISSPNPDPKGFAFAIEALVARIQKGEKIYPGVPQEGLFGKFNGAIRRVLPVYLMPYLGTAARYYEHFDFQALQIFWPDKKGAFPWQVGFQEDYLRAQPNLWQPNLVLAGLGQNTLKFMDKNDPKLFQDSFDELFLKLTGNELQRVAQILEPLIQESISVLKVSVFGDVAFKLQDGNTCWFDSGFAEWDQLPTDQGTLEQIVCFFPSMFVHQNLMLTLKHMDMQLEPGQVFSWTLPLSLGGEASVKNLSFVDVFVHLMNVAKQNLDQS